MTFKHSVNAVPADKWGRVALLPLAFVSPERGLGAVPSRLPRAGLREPAAACRADLHRPPGPGAAGLGAVPWDLVLRQSPTPRSEACMIAKSLEGQAGVPGLFILFIHLQLSLPPYPSASLLLCLGPRQLPMQRLLLLAAVPEF